ncbi:hypothetical protein LJR153_003471 [Paenibacillus sp. LjRoot153]|uniref:hypothetical protein n=1 Tax=Paenibacillus sp. LjRoot153 TaxID=3342270 RepID=UPI003ECD4EE4
MDMSRLNRGRAFLLSVIFILVIIVVTSFNAHLAGKILAGGLLILGASGIGSGFRNKEEGGWTFHPLILSIGLLCTFIGVSLSGQ